MKDLFTTIKNSFFDLIDAMKMLLSSLLILLICLICIPFYPFWLIGNTIHLKIWYLYHFTQFYQIHLNERSVWIVLKDIRRVRDNNLKRRLERKWATKIIRRYRSTKWQEEERWIPIDQELPEKHKSVNVILKDGTYTHSFLLDDGFWAYNVEPTHWKHKITPESISTDPRDKTSEG